MTGKTGPSAGATPALSASITPSWNVRAMTSAIGLRQRLARQTKRIRMGESRFVPFSAFTGPSFLRFITAA